jgi:hypothetical protein
MQASSEAIQSTNGVKKKKRQPRNIPEDISTNPMAPAPSKRGRRKADVLHILHFCLPYR